MKHYTVWGYDEVDAVLADADLFSSAIAHKRNAEKAFGRILVVMDPPDHTRYRKFLASAFSPKPVRQWTENLIRPVIHELIDAFVDSGSAELVEQFTYRYPFEAVFRCSTCPHRMSTSSTSWRWSRPCRSPIS